MAAHAEVPSGAPESTDGPERWKTIVEILAGIAGLVVFVNVVGAVVLVTRLNTLGLAGSSLVPAFSKEQLFEAGLVALVRPLGFGIAAAGSVVLLRRGRGLTITLVIVAVLVVATWEALDWKGWALALGAGVLAVLACTRLIPDDASPLRCALAAFVVLGLYGGVVAYVVAARPPKHLPFATALLATGDETGGYLIAQTGDEIILAPGFGGFSARVAVRVPRADVKRLSVGPGEEITALGTDRPRSLARKLTQPSADEAARQRISQFIAILVGERHWRYPPHVIVNSAAELLDNRGAFLTPDDAVWPTSALPSANVADLVADVDRPSGGAIVIRGVLADSWPLARGTRSPRRLVIRGSGGAVRPWFECVVFRHSDVPAAGAPVEAWVIPIAFGRTVAHPGRRTVTGFCGAIRRDLAET
jgi:hypothetical protein